jgi:hypothetical protein
MLSLYLIKLIYKLTDSWKTNRMKLKYLKNLIVVCSKWRKSIWLVDSYYILKQNKELVNENNKSKNEIKCKKL